MVRPMMMMLTLYLGPRRTDTQTDGRPFALILYVVSGVADDDDDE